MTTSPSRHRSLNSPQTSDWIALGGSLLAAVALFLPWYATDPTIPASQIDGARGALSGWAVHDLMRFAVLALVSAPIAVFATVARGNSAPRHLVEAAMVAAVNGVGVFLFFGLLDRPGEPMLTISLQYGWLLSLVGMAIALAATLHRIQAFDRRPVTAPAVPADPRFAARRSVPATATTSG